MVSSKSRMALVATAIVALCAAALTAQRVDATRNVSLSQAPHVKELPTLPPHPSITIGGAQLRATAAAYLSQHSISATVDGHPVDPTAWATVMAGEAQHEELANLESGRDRANPGVLTPNPGDDHFAKQALAQLVLDYLLNVEGLRMGNPVSTQAVTAIVQQQQQAAAQRRPGVSIDTTVAIGSPEYRKMLTVQLRVEAMRARMLSETPGTTEGGRLATWVMGVLPRHNVSVNGISSFTASDIPALVQ